MHARNSCARMQKKIPNRTSQAIQHQPVNGNSRLDSPPPLVKLPTRYREVEQLQQCITYYCNCHGRLGYERNKQHNSGGIITSNSLRASLSSTVRVWRLSSAQAAIPGNLAVCASLNLATVSLPAVGGLCLCQVLPRSCQQRPRNPFSSRLYCARADPYSG